MLQLSMLQRQQLHEALIDAFRTKSSLEQMLLFGLDKRLAEIAGEGSLKDIIFKLIQTAEAEGWIEDLIRAARDSTSGNPKLQAIAQILDPTSKIRHKDSFPQQPVTNNTYKLPFNQLVKNKLIIGVTILLIGLAGFSLYNQNSNLPNNAYLYYTQGLTYAGKMEWDNAIKNYNQALRLKSDYTEAYYNLGLAYAGKMEWDNAIKNYNQALRLKSDYTEAYYNLGLAYKSKGSKHKAVEDLKKVLELNKDVELSQKASQQLQELGTK